MTFDIGIRAYQDGIEKMRIHELTGIETTALAAVADGS